jgi:CDP-glycerol glycerophosphotransferase
VPCLDSITTQAFQDVEVIAVDGGSTDLTRELLEKRMTEEPRLTMACSGRGPGVARNAGASKATGEYLWFVDGDDEIAPGCLSSISERLLAERPDVLLINHAELRSDRVLVTGQDDALLSREDGASFLLAERPQLLEASMVSWNKVVRRAFFESIGAEFPQRWPHEDVPVSCELLLAAQRLSVLEEVCYYHRRLRPGSATGAGPRDRHFAVFGSWREVLQRNRDRMPRESGEPRISPEIYLRLFRQSIWHCTTILDTAGYIARADRRGFFSQIAALYTEYRPDQDRLPGGFRGVKFWLIARKSYLGYSILDPLNRFRIRLERFLRARGS